MGVFINGMVMPRVCAECFMDTPCCEALSGDINIWKERHPKCPLVEIPPHGDLIDRDALIDTLSSSDRDIYVKCILEEDAPVVIEGSL